MYERHKFVCSELTHFVKVLADGLHAVSLEIILVIPAAKRGLETYNTRALECRRTAMSLFFSDDTCVNVRACSIWSDCSTTSLL